jgi:site-specific recombinase XerD
MESRACDLLGGKWLLYWTSRDVPVPRGFLPQLDEWAGIDGRERALSIEPGTPILIDPAGRIDPRLAYFLRRPRFASLAEESKNAYAKDYRLFFTFLHQREKHWDQADHEDIDDYESWRRRSEDNPRRIGGSKWARELAAFKLLYGWAVAVGHIDRSPVLTHTVRRRDGTVVEVASNQPKDVRASNVKWLTPRTYRLWRDIGLRGYTAAGLPQAGWRGRNDGRNAAFADLLFDSGLRLREAGCLLTLEVPHALSGHVYYEGTVAAAIAKRSERMFYVSAAALAGVTTYMATTRRAAIRRAQRQGRYDRMRGVRVVTRISHGKVVRVAWEDRLGRRGEEAIRLIGERGRRWLFIQGTTGMEPLALWLTEGGMPMDYRSWEAVFRQGVGKVARWSAFHDCLKWSVGLSGVVAEGCGDVGGPGQAQDGDREVAQAGHDSGAVAGADLGAVLVVGHVADPVQAVLDGPVAAQDVGEFGGVGLDRGQGGDRVDGLGRPLHLRLRAAGRPAASDDLDGLGGVREA